MQAMDVVDILGCNIQVGGVFPNNIGMRIGKTRTQPEAISYAL